TRDANILLSASTPRQPPVRTSVSNAISVPGRRQTATIGLSGLVKPRVVVDRNLVETSVSPTRDDLRSHANCNRTWSAPAKSYLAIHETLADGFGCYFREKSPSIAN